MTDEDWVIRITEELQAMAEEINKQKVWLQNIEDAVNEVLDELEEIKAKVMEK